MHSLSLQATYHRLTIENLITNLGQVTGLTLGPPLPLTWAHIVLILKNKDNLNLAILLKD